MHEADTKVSVCEACKLPYSDIASHVCSQMRPAIEDPYINLLINGRFRIESSIGIGGWSMVYRARDEKLGRPVAVKLLHLPLASDPEKRRRFENEARAASRLSHPNIVATYDYGITPMGQPYIVMEYLEGETLSDRIKRAGSIAPSEAAEMFAQAAEGLAYAHFRGLVHRDIKPSNMFITDGTVGGCTLKIVDFGLAKSLGNPEDISEITTTGQTVGSPAYMSPEQCMGEKLDARSDVYSLAVSMFEAIAGVKPFQGNPMECMSAHVGGTVPTFNSINPELRVPAELELAIVKGLAKRKEERFQSALDFRDAIKAGVRGRRPTVPKLTRWIRKYKSPQGKYVRWALRAIVYGTIAWFGYWHVLDPFIAVNFMGATETIPVMKRDDELAYMVEEIERDGDEGRQAAKEFIEVTLNDRMRKEGTMSPHAGTAALMLADWYERNKEPEMAYYYYKYASQCLSGGHDTGAYAESLGRLSELAMEQGHLNDAVRAADDLVKLETRHYGKDSQQLANARELQNEVMRRVKESKGKLPASLKTNSKPGGVTQAK